MSHTSNIRTNDTDVTLIATVYNTDGSVKSDLAWNTTGISIFVQRIGVANGTPLTLSNKATPATSHVDGQFLNLGGGNISVDIPDAPVASYIGQIRIYGTFTGGTIIGDWYDVVGYDATAVAVGANTTTPPTAAANATQVRTELATELARIDTTVSSRLASASYTAPSSASTIADAVWAKDISAATGSTAGAYLKDIWGRITAAVYTLFTNLIAMITGTGANASFTAKAMENTASSVYVLPTKGTQQDRRTSTDEIRIYRTEGYTLVRTVEDDAKALVDLSGKTLELIIEGENRNDKAVIPDGDISVSGTSNATYTIDIPTTVSAKSGKTYSFWLWDKTNSSRPKLLDKGRFVVEYAGTSFS